MTRQAIPFGKYFLLDRINVGGMAEVWKAKTYGVEGFEKVVAIKRILPSIAEDEEFVAMFIDEAKISVQLTHAHIGHVFDLGKIEESFFIALEYVPGKDLRAIFDRMRRRGETLPIPLTAWMVARVAEGLDYAHRRRDADGRDLGIVHRDVSPQNVLVSYDGEVKLIDFGIAKAAGKASRTQAGILKGKFGYMSPEQVRGLTIDRRSDVFGLGVVLYELLTGERAFLSDSDFTTLEKVRNVDILPPRTFNPRIPEALEAVVLRALAREPSERYQWASELAEELGRFTVVGDTVLSRKEVNRFMQSTFAEDLEKEKVKAAEAEAFRLPAHMGAALPGIRRAAPLPPAVPDPHGTITERTPVPRARPPVVVDEDPPAADESDWRDTEPDLVLADLAATSPALAPRSLRPAVLAAALGLVAAVALAFAFHVLIH